MDRPKAIMSIGLILVFLIAQLPFSLAQWIAIAPAPSDTGIYNIIIRAEYDDVTGEFPLELTVDGATYPVGQLEVEPVYPMSKDQPIKLRYDIEVNDSKVFDMIWNQVSIYYVSGTNIQDSVLLKSEDMALEKNANTEHWESSFEVPFAGEYRAVVSLIVRKGDEEYGGEFMTQFESNEASPDLLLESAVDKKVLVPAETFTISMKAVYEEREISNMSIFKATMGGDTKTLVWNNRDRAYVADFDAPSDEGIYRVSIFAEDQDYVVQEKVYVAKTSLEKSARCPLAYEEVQGCTDMRDVRTCVNLYKSESIQITEEEIIACYESASGGITYNAIICEEDYVGDLDGDQYLDVDDLDLLKNVILPLSESERMQYEDCADYDLNGKVEQGDLTCLTNVIAGTWWGDLQGGVCIDSDYSAPLKGDLDSDDFVTDEDLELMDTVIYAADEGVSMDQIILDAVDFNQDGRITDRDKTCMNYFYGMDLTNPDTLLSFGQTIPSDCLRIYHLDACQGIRGDINGDLRIDAIDEILVNLIEREQIAPADYEMDCADVNEDDLVSSEDVVCVTSYLQGDYDAYYVCIGCDDNIPNEYREIYEICNDGFDNDCDGMVDRTSMNPDDDSCICSANTECWRVWDNDGGATAGIGDANVKVCRLTSWSASSSATTGAASAEYRWHLPSELACGSSRECNSMYCAGTRYVCAYNGLVWQWYSNPSNLPKESNIPTDNPKLCGDGFDNDCCNGDMECEESDWTDMFSEPSFWIGAVTGLLVSMAWPGAILLYAAIGFGGAMIPEKSVSAFFSGFGIGAALGTIAASATGGATAASSGAQVTQVSTALAAKMGASAKAIGISLAVAGAAAYGVGQRYASLSEDDWNRHFASC